MIVGNVQARGGACRAAGGHDIWTLLLLFTAHPRRPSSPEALEPPRVSKATCSNPHPHVHSLSGTWSCCTPPHLDMLEAGGMDTFRRMSRTKQTLASSRTEPGVQRARDTNSRLFVSTLKQNLLVWLHVITWSLFRHRFWTPEHVQRHQTGVLEPVLGRVGAQQTGVLEPVLGAPC